MRGRRTGQETSPGKADDGSWIEISGRVVRLLPFDTDLARHQRFVVDLGDGRSVLLVHNVELGGAVPVALGDRVAARGVYEWSDRGGVVHWTHDDPLDAEAGGYVVHRRKTWR